MSLKLKITTDKKAISDNLDGGSFINASGLYPVTINFASLAVSKNGAESVNFNVTYNGNTQTLWGPYITNSKGEQLDIGVGLLIKLGIIAGMEDGDEFTIEEEEHAVGKDNKVQEFAVITEFSDLDCIIHIQEEYSKYQEEIKQRLNIRGFFRADGASAEEIVEDKELGERLALVEEKYATRVTYKDDLTAEDIEEWKKNGYGKGDKVKGTVKTAGKKSSLFKRK